MPMPSPELEVWRYSRIAELDLARYAPTAVRSTVTGAEGLLGETEVTAALAAGADVHDILDELSAAHHTTVAITLPAGRDLA